MPCHLPVSKVATVSLTNVLVFQRALATKVRELIQSGAGRAIVVTWQRSIHRPAREMRKSRRRKLRLTNRGLDLNEDEADATWQPSVV